jgi:hypothetical protein
MIQQHPDDLPAAIGEIVMRCLARPPDQRELKYLAAAYTDLLRLSEIGARQATPEAEPKLAAMIAVARIVMNLDEFITRD